MATGENDEGATVIEKAEGNGTGKKRKSRTKNQSSIEGTGPKAKRAQYCTICKNHNQQVLKKRHKCPYRECKCPLCQLSRRVQCIMCHQQRLWRFRKSMEKNGSSSSSSSQGTKEPSTSSPSSSSPSSSSSSPPSSVTEGDSRLQELVADDPLTVADGLKAEGPSKQQVCDKCRNHDVWVLKRGHKGQCHYENCTCQYCSFTIKRRDLMKHQQRVRRAQVTSLPTKDSRDFILQPVETTGQPQQSSNCPPVEESTGASPGLSPADMQERQTNLATLSNEGEQVLPSCTSERTEEPRTSPTIPQEPSRECATFQQPMAMDHAATTYRSMPLEQPQMQSPQLQMKAEPNFDNGIAYDSRGNLAPYREFVTPDQDFTPIGNYSSDPEMHLLRQQQMQPKFGVDPEDLQLRRWATTKEVEVDVPTSFSDNGRHFRGSSVCIPVPQTHHLPQPQMQPQSAHHPVVTTNPTTFQPLPEPHSAPLVGWGSHVSLPCVTSSTLHTSEVVQPQFSAMPSAACEAYEPTLSAHSQGIWWQPVRLATLERTNSG